MSVEIQQNHRLSVIRKSVDDARRVADTVNSSFMLVNNLKSLASLLTGNEVSITSWEKSLESARRGDTSFDQRREMKFNTLLDIQSAVSRSVESTHIKQGLAANIDGSFLADMVSSAAAMTGMLTLVDGYLTRRELKNGFNALGEKVDALGEKIDSGFGMLVKNLEAGFSELNANFDWGFSELIWRFEQQTEIAEQIRDILANPGKTKSIELRAKGIEFYMFGWLDESKQALLKVLEDPVAADDYVTEFYLGNIFLYQKNYDNAIRYYGQSAKHAQPHSRSHYVYSLMHQGFVYYIANRVDKHKDFQCAASCIRKAIDYKPHCNELKYQLAQYEALAGEAHSSINIINEIIHSDPKYVIKILAESDFVSIRAQIDEMLLNYDRELSKIFLKLFDDIARAVSFLSSICDNKGIPFKIGGVTVRSKYTDSNTFHGPISGYGLHEVECHIVGRDWHFSGGTNCMTNDGNDNSLTRTVTGVLRPLSDQVLKEICDDSENIVSTLEEATEIYNHGDIISRKVAIDILTEITFKSINKIPFDYKTGLLKVAYCSRFATRLGGNWYDGGQWYYETEKGTKEVYIGIGGDRV